METTGYHYLVIIPLILAFCAMCYYCPITSSLLLLACLATYVNYFLRSLKVSARNKAVLITGCGSGFGNSLAINLNKAGFIVFACCRNDQSDGAMKLKALDEDKNGSRIHVIKMDVKKQEQVDDAFNYVKNNLEKDEALWGLVNNAGIFSVGFVEWLKMEDFEKMVAVNLFGTIRVTKKFAPLIRKSQGRIVNISSINGRVSLRYVSAYCISKYGLEAFSNVLRREMRQFKVKVCTIQPGHYGNATGIVRGANGLEKGLRNLWDNLDASVQESYGRQLVDDGITLNKVMQGFPTMDISPVINAMIDSLSRLYPETHYIVGSLVEIFFVHLDELLPAWITDPLFSFGEKCLHFTISFFKR